MKKNTQGIDKYWPYILEIRKKLILVLVVFFIGFVAGFLFFRQIINGFLNIFDFNQVTMVVISPFQIFSLGSNIGLLCGVLLSFPILVFSCINFIKPALKKDEKKMIIPVIIFSFLLFFLGFGFGLLLMRWIIFGLSKTFFIGGVDNYWDIGLFLSQIFLTALFLGLIFQFPIILTILVKLNLIKVDSLKKKRPFIIVGILIFVALLPPTDAFSLILMTFVLIIFFELTLFLLGRKE